MTHQETAGGHRGRGLVGTGYLDDESRLDGGNMLRPGNTPLDAASLRVTQVMPELAGRVVSASHLIDEQLDTFRVVAGT
jgi:hypothetical protein